MVRLGRFTGILFLFSVLFLQLYCSGDKALVTKETYASLDSTVTYVGMETCKGCHQDIYNTYIRTGMGLSIDQASRKKTSADFGKHPDVYDKFRNLNYHPFWENDSLYFLEYRMLGKDTVHSRKEKIASIIGSGQHTNSHIYNVNGYLYQAPMTYYTQSGKWDLPPGFENGNNTRFDRIIGLECMSCHNAYPKLELGSENKYSAVPDGIDCERCHGPGSRHVEEKKSGKLIDISTAIDYSIVNPAKLPVDLQIDLCSRCHIQGNAVLNEGKSFYDFHPGMKLSDVMNVFMPVYKGNDEEHIMASHAERMKQSRCYIETSAKIQADISLQKTLKPYSNALTCVTCHNPHVSRLETPAGHFNNACNNCHGAGKTECNETELIRLKNNNDCVKCHMPENGAIDIPHVRVHDHKIKIPVSESEKNKIKEFAGIIAVNNPNPPDASKAAAFINYFEKFGMDKYMLDSALKYLPQNNREQVNTNLHLLVQLYFLKKEYYTLIRLTEQAGDVYSRLNKKSYDNKDAWTCYRIAEAFKLTGRSMEAEKYYRRCYELAPLDPNFANEFAEILASNGKTAEAMRIFKTIIEMQPKFAPSYSNLGYLYLSVEKNSKKAGELYDKALALNPDYTNALFNKAALFMMNGSKKEAISALKKILNVEPGNEKAIMALKQLQQ
jgi:Cytochrome c554 and c-prime/Tetratricopeptide repeat